MKRILLISMICIVTSCGFNVNAEEGESSSDKVERTDSFKKKPFFCFFEVNENLITGVISNSNANDPNQATTKSNANVIFPWWNIGIGYRFNNNLFTELDLSAILFPTLNIGFDPFDNPDYDIQGSLGIGFPYSANINTNSQSYLTAMPINAKIKLAYNNVDYLRVSPFISYRLTYLNGKFMDYQVSGSGGIFAHSLGVGININFG